MPWSQQWPWPSQGSSQPSPWRNNSNGASGAEASAWWQSTPTAPTSEQWGSEWWRCSICNQWCMQQKKKCTWASVAQSAQHSHSHQSDSGWNWQHSHSHETQTEEYGDQSQQATREKSDMVNFYEGVLRDLPDREGMQETRIHLEEQVTRLKRETTSSRPVASQLVSCEAALVRAADKLRDHGAEVVRIPSEASKARERVQELELERMRLQSMVAQPNESNSIMKLGGALRQVLDDMAQSGAVCNETMGHARTAMDNLYSGLQHLCTEPQRQQHAPSAAAAAATDADASARSHTGSEPGCPPADKLFKNVAGAPARRLNSKTTPAAVDVEMADAPFT